MNRISSIGSAFASTLLALAGLGHSDHAAAATLSVTNCNNEGQGSLREAVRIALSGDAIDLRHLPCPKITLIGAIMVQQPDLQFLGPGFRKLSVSGNRTSSVFRHPGGGALKLSGLTVEDGSWTDTTSNRALAEGGCIYSTGTVSLYDVEVRNCEAAPYFLDGTAQGGGIYAGGVTARFSAIYSNVVRGGYSSGGGIHAAYVMLYRAKVHHNHAGNAAGIYSIYGVEMDHSSISNNHALRFAGGFQTDYDAKITNSTISNNVAGREGGGFRNTTSSPSSTAIVNSTISGNVARDASAAYIVGGASVINSTIAFNRRNTMPGQHPTGTLSMGTDPTGSGTSHLLLISSILADNTVDGQPDIDFFVRDAQMHMLGEFSIVLSSNAPLPADTIRADPMLAPLADNGGRTWTHALLDGSPAIDHGNNEAGLAYDQRGTGFPRVKGAAPDIGSYER